MVLLTCLLPGELTAQNAPPNEYQIKAAFILNFAQFIQWPAASFGDASQPIVIGILGDDPFGEMLEQTFANEVVGGRALVVKRARQVDDLKSSHLLFVSKSERDRVTTILNSLRDSAVVTIGEVENFAQRGGIINFYMDGRRVRFEINADAAQKKGIRIHSQLLARAKIIGALPGRAGA